MRTTPNTYLSTVLFCLIRLFLGTKSGWKVLLTQQIVGLPNPHSDSLRTKSWRSRFDCVIFLDTGWQRILNFCFFITSLILSDCSDKFRRIILMKLLTKDIFDGQYEWLSKGFLPFCGLHGSIIIIFILIPDSEPPFCSRHYKLQRKKPFGFSGPPSFRYVRQLACRHLGQVVKKLLLWWSLLS